MKHQILFTIIFFVAASTYMQAQQNQGQQNNPQNPQAPGQVQQQSRQQAAPESTEWYYPVPAKVQPGVGTKPPSDAIVLFDGKDLSKWRTRDNSPAQWVVKDGELIVEPGKGSIISKDYFGDCQLHIEFKSPAAE